MRARAVPCYTHRAVPIRPAVPCACGQICSDPADLRRCKNGVAPLGPRRALLGPPTASRRAPRAVLASPLLQDSSKLNVAQKRPVLLQRGEVPRPARNQ